MSETIVQVPGVDDMLLAGRIFALPEQEFPVGDVQNLLDDLDRLGSELLILGGLALDGGL